MSQTAEPLLEAWPDQAAFEAAYPRLEVELDDHERERIRSELALAPSIPEARIAFQLGAITHDEFMEIVESEERKAEEDTQRARDSWPEGCDPHPPGPTPAELVEDLKAAKALAERRNTSPSRFDDFCWDGIAPWMVDHMRAQQKAYDERFDAHLVVDIGRLEQRVWSAKMRGLLPGQGIQSLPLAGQRRSRARESRSAPARRARTGTSRSGTDPPPEPDLDPDPALPGAAGPVVVPGRTSAPPIDRRCPRCGGVARPLLPSALWTCDVCADAIWEQIVQHESGRVLAEADRITRGEESER